MLSIVTVKLTFLLDQGTKFEDFRVIQIENISREQLKCDSICKQLPATGNKTVGNEENADYQHFLLFPQYFFKNPLWSETSVKCGNVW